MEIVTRQEQRLAHDALVRLGEEGHGGVVPGAEDVREGAEDGAEVGEQLALLARRGGDGQVEGARRADGLLDQVGERPAAADVGRVGRVRVRDGARVVDQVVDVDVGVRGRGRQGEQHREEGVLEEHGLPELAAQLLVEDAGGGADDVRVAVEAHGVRLPD